MLYPRDFRGLHYVYKSLFGTLIMAWTTIERPGYLGRKRNDMYEIWTERYGEGNWRIAYQWKEDVIPLEVGIQIYEDGYYEFLKNNNSILEWLVSRASDVYDTDPTNVHSGFDYAIQETENNHIHDIAIRRVVARLGKSFEGEHLLWIRSKSEEGRVLSPGNVPFHLPELIVQEEIKDYSGIGMWWEKDSIEDFYQKNKILQVQS